METNLLPLHECGPLHGIRVVDFGVYLAGPMVGRALADAGAHVVHVVPPGGPVWKNPELNFILSRGKHVVELDLKTLAGKAEVWKLLKNCDVVIENFATGVMNSFGMGSKDVRAVNPRCVYLSMPGFASNDTVSEVKELKAFEAIILAKVGVFTDMGLNRTLMGINPSYSPLPLASAYASILGSLAVTMALLHREARSGEGDTLEVPLAAALCDALIYNSMEVPIPERYLTMRELEIAKRRERGEAMQFKYHQIKELLDPFYHTYKCQDGRPFYVVAPCHALHQKRTLQVLGIWEDMLALGIPQGNVYAPSEDWRDDKGNAVNMLLGTYPITDPVWIVRLKEAMKAAFLTKTALQWERIFMANKITACATLTTKEWINSEHALASGLIQERHWTPPLKTGSNTGTSPVILREPGPVVWLERSRVRGSEATRRKTSEHARRALLVQAKQTTALGEETQTSPTTNKAPQKWLSGVRVVDFCNVIAGPTIGGMLARFGATVIKVDPSNATYDALVAVFMGLPINAGKMSLLADVKKKEGREILERLVCWTDVVLCNQVSSQIRSLGLDELTLKQINPHVILTRFDAFGGPYHGPRSDAIGYDDLLQASTGIMARFGGSIDTPEEHAHLGTIDVVSGFAGALVTCLALFKRLRTGQADIARTSLAANAQQIQAPFMFDYDGRAPFNEASGSNSAGEHALYRWYKTLDGGHIFVACSPPGTAGYDVVQNALIREGLPATWGSSTEVDKVATLQRLLNQKCSNEADAKELLEQSGASVVAAGMSSLANLRDKNKSNVTVFRTTENKNTFHFTTFRDHAIGGDITMFAPCSILSEKVPVHVLSPAPKYGEHSRKILQDILNFKACEVDEFLNAGIVAEEWSQDYIPGGNPWENVSSEYDAMIRRIEELRVPPAKL